jgi:hypothetical protein
MKAQRILSHRRLLIGLAVALMGLLGALPALAGTAGTTYYTCYLTTSGLIPIPLNPAAEKMIVLPPPSPINTCTDGIITATYSSGVQRVMQVNLSPSYVRLDIFIDVCNPTGYWSHIGDSPTNDGYGGDYGTAQHDAEAYMIGTSFQTYSMDNPRINSWPSYRADGVVPTSGCYRVQWTAWESHFQFDDDGNPSDTPRVDFASSRSIESAPYNEPDSEDSSGANANLWYVGLNRTVYNPRTGTGVNQACFVLSTTTNPSPATLTALCP